MKKKRGGGKDKKHTLAALSRCSFRTGQNWFHVWVSWFLLRQSIIVNSVKSDSKSIQFPSQSHLGPFKSWELGVKSCFWTELRSSKTKVPLASFTWAQTGLLIYCMCKILARGIAGATGMEPKSTIYRVWRYTIGGIVCVCISVCVWLSRLCSVCVGSWVVFVHA